jgi:hypothetical protein
LPCSKPSAQSATATKKNSRTAWPTTAEAHRHIRCIEHFTATATRRTYTVAALANPERLRRARHCDRQR